MNTSGEQYVFRIHERSLLSSPKASYLIDRNHTVVYIGAIHYYMGNRPRMVREGQHKHPDGDGLLVERTKAMCSRKSRGPASLGRGRVRS